MRAFLELTEIKDYLKNVNKNQNKFAGLKYNTYICFINLKIMEKFDLETKPTLFDKLKRCFCLKIKFFNYF